MRVVRAPKAQSPKPKAQNHGAGDNGRQTVKGAKRVMFEPAIRYRLLKRLGAGGMDI